MAKKQSSRKPSKKTEKTPTETVPAKASRPRDPRLPAVGTTIVRPYKGTEHRIKVLVDGFQLDGKETFKSLTALARRVTSYPAISGPAWIRLTKDAAAPKDEKPAEPKKRAPKARRAGRDPQPATPTETPVEAAAPETATV